MPTIDTKFYEKKKRNTLYFSLGFFIFVLLLTGGMYGYNMTLEQKLKEQKTEISGLDRAIHELRANPEIETYSLYERNKMLLERKACESRITTFITHLKRNAGKYSLSAKGFSYSAGSIQTDISAGSDNSQSAHGKIVNFLENYPEEENAFFDIGHIGEYDGFDRINFSPRFTLNATMYENCSQS